MIKLPPWVGGTFWDTVCIYNSSFRETPNRSRAYWNNETGYIRQQIACFAVETRKTCQP